MFENLTFSGRELLLAIVLATAVYLLEALVFSRRRGPGHDHRMTTRLAELEQEVATLKARLDSLEAHPPFLDSQKSIHAEAARMAREGVSAKELAAHLGISLTEADLIIALHKSEP